MRHKLALTTVVSISLFLGFALLNSTKIHAGTCSWNGSIDANWSTDANWDAGCEGAGGIPADGDILNFPADGDNKAMANDITGLNLWSLNFETGDYSLNGEAIELIDGTTADTGTPGFNLNLSLSDHLAFGPGVYNGIVTLNGFELDLDNTNDNIFFNNSITGNGDLRQLAGGNVTYLQSDNDFIGDVNIEFGDLRVNTSAGLGNAANVINILDDGTLSLHGDTLILPYTINTFGGCTITNIDTANILTGPISVDERLFINVTGGSLTVSGVISGATVTKQGGTELIFTGTESNTFGGFDIDDGTVTLAKTNPAIALPNGALVGDGAGGAAVLISTDDEQIADGSHVAIQSDGEWNLDGNIETLNEFSVLGGSFTGNGGQLITDEMNMIGGVANSGDLGVIEVTESIIGASNGVGAGTILGSLDYGANNIIINGNGGPELIDLMIVAEISGSGTISYSGGIIALDGPNTYTGASIVTGDIILLSNDALGDPTAGTTINGTGTVTLQGDVTIDENFNLNSSGKETIGALNSTTGTNTINGNIVLQTTSAISVQDGTLIIDSVISGNGNITLFGTDSDDSNLVLEGINTYQGITALMNITVYNLSGNIFPDNNRVSLNNAVLDFSDAVGTGQGETIGSLAGNSSSIINLDDEDLVLGADNSNSTYAGLITGSGTLTKNGNGTFKLTGNNTYTGDTTINNGILAINGNQPSSNIELINGELNGNGTTGPVNSTDGIFNPGDPLEILTISGNLDLTSNTVSEFDLNGTEVGSGYDQAQVSEDINLNNSDLLINLGFTPSNGDTFIILESEGLVNGIFNNLPNGSTFTVDNVEFTIVYNSNSIILTAQNVLADAGIDVLTPSIVMLLVIGLVLAINNIDGFFRLTKDFINLNYIYYLHKNAKL